MENYVIRLDPAWLEGCTWREIHHCEAIRRTAGRIQSGKHGSTVITLLIQKTESGRK